MVHLYEIPTIGKSIKTERRSMVIRGVRLGEKMSDWIDIGLFSAQQRCYTIDCDDGCITL